MKHDALNFRNMSPTEIMHFLSWKHFPAIEHLIEQINVHLATTAKVNTSSDLPLRAMENEYRELALLVKNQMRKQGRILFPFIDNVLEDEKNNMDVLSDLEFEMSEVYSSHMQMRNYLANLSALSNGFKPGLNSSETMKVTFSELHSLEQQLYRQFYLEDVLLLPKVSRLAFKHWGLTISIE
jgi:iron-sulfur cluster repair protein YtfE (RIC family)